ncbi:MAG: Phosphate import ATP-binding protein PstB [Candidatus Curtissbacteria bacterium GW2011_GWD1_40_8]|nr:MAG: Phosphate import ATP-binding protein PstB [Candidatus Curtissbacteria bacterium GW2011_GWD1_40_8]OHD11171.1 MAG: hypothetical protein A2Z98_07960 [Spirochaetes bacterium GWB1_27_13]OHD26334.1 MAG: hypothetical protein A2Y34_09115 [Spirochaetes bacterium GWC1_27_15]
MENKLIYEIKNLKFSYNKKNILDIEKLNIYPNKIYALLGANGSGKTTLLKILNGLLKVKEKSVFFENIPIEENKYSLVREKTIYVHQNPFLLTGTVFDNVSYGLKLKKLNAKVIKEKVYTALEKLGISKLETRHSDELSGGEIQRVAIARALILEPKVLFLDEPTANIDNESMIQIESILNEINTKSQTTIIFTSHNSFFGYRMCNEVIMLKDGKVEKKPV